MNSFKIGNVTVGGESSPVVIPEIGINHGGSLAVACEMAEAAKRAGAKLIKHQTHIIDDEMSSEARKVIPGNSKTSIYDVMEQCALSEDEEREFMNYVENLGMEFISTPFSRAAAERLYGFGVKAFKIGSGEMNNYPLIEHVASYGKPMIVSTGMNSLESIDKTIEILEKKNIEYALMHCTNIYPTQPEQVRLGAMLQMMERYKGIPIGLSDHTVNNNACIAAIALGASLVERHFTDKKTRVGNDIVCSMDIDELKNLLLAADEVHRMRGGTKVPHPDEQVTIDFAFATVVSIAPIKKGDYFSIENIWVKRPGIGEIPAEQYESLLGRKASCDIPIDVHISKTMVI